MNEQQMQQLLAFMQQQMQAQQQGMADLPQRAQQAGATPTVGSGGVVLSPDPVRRVQQQNEAWRERFPGVVEQAARLGMTPEALQASRGMDAMGQWAMLGGVPGVDPAKLRETMNNARAYREAAAANRNGTNGRVTEITPASSVVTPSQPNQTSSPNQAPAAPVTAGVPSIPVGDVFSGAGSAVSDYAQNAPQAWREMAIPNAPVNTSVAPPIEGSDLRQNILQGLNFVPNMLLGAGSTIAEGLGSLFGKQVDLPSVNLQSDIFSNLKNVLGGVPSYDASRGGFQNETAAEAGLRRAEEARQQSTASSQLLGEGAFDSVSGPYQDEQRSVLLQNRMDRNANPAGYLGAPSQPAPALQLSQPNAAPQTPIAFQGNVTPASLLPQNMFMTEEERKRRQTNQPMIAGR